MPSYVVKPVKDEDFYVLWSSVVDAPVAFGPRSFMLDHLTRQPGNRHDPATRLDRADDTGTSVVDAEVYGWDDDIFIYLQQGILRRGRLKELCVRLGQDVNADVSDLLERFDGDEAVTTGG